MVQPLLNVEQIVIILLFGVVGAKIADRFNLPSIIPLLLSGFLLGPEVLGLFDPSKIGLSLTTLATILTPLILFNEGMHIEISNLNKFRRPVFLLATLGVVVTMLGVGLIAHYIIGMSLINSLLLGAILSATDPGAVHSIAKRLRIGVKISTIVEGESAFNDASSLVLTTILTGVALGGLIQVENILLEFIRLFFGGIIMGGLIAIVAADLLNRFRIQVYAVSISLALFLVVFSASEALGFSGITAVVAAGIMFGDTLRSKGFRINERNRTHELWRNILFLAQSIIFLVLGAGISYSAFSSDSVKSIIIMITLFFIARPVAVFVSTYHIEYLRYREKWFISWVGARGAISAALASAVVGAGIVGAMSIFNITLIVVVVTLLIVSLTSGKLAFNMLEIEQISPMREEFYKDLAEYLATREGINELDQRFQEGGIDIGTLRALRGELKNTMINMEEKLENYYAQPEFAKIKEEEKINIMKELIQIKIETAENLKARGDLPEPVFKELMSRYNNELDKLNDIEKTSFGLNEIYRSLRGLL